MVKELVHDPMLLSMVSEDAAADDEETARDLLDTITAHSDTCVGMAANMIGVRKRIIVFFDGKGYTLMFNPEIIKREQPFETKEGCLSLLGGPRQVRRWKKIKVRWQNEKAETRIKVFTDFTAQIIQHEIDHCSGILI